MLLKICMLMIFKKRVKKMLFMLLASISKQQYNTDGFGTYIIMYVKGLCAACWRSLNIYSVWILIFTQFH